MLTITTTNLGGIMPNRIPTDAEINRETLHLDAYGITVSNLLSEYPIDLHRYIKKQDILSPLIDAMAEEGWAFSGAGYFAAVFVKDGLALKIGFKVTDTGAMYAAWCRANTLLPGVPKVFSLTKFSRCYVVLMRRYDEVNADWFDEDSEDFDADAAAEFEEIRTALNTGNAPVEIWPTTYTARAIRGFFDGAADFDLHPQNVMLDENDEFILTDPISYGACSDSLSNGYTTDTPDFTGSTT